MIADQTAQQITEFAERLRNIDNLRLHLLLAGKREQLAHQIGRAVGVLLDLHNVSERRVSGAVALQQQITEANHRGQQIIEIMGNPAGKLTHRLHLLSLRELDLEILLLRRIHDMRDHAICIAFRIKTRADPENCRPVIFTQKPCLKLRSPGRAHQHL